MDIRLWERNLYVVLIECIIDGLQYLAVVTKLREHIHPDDNLEEEG